MPIRLPTIRLIQQAAYGYVLRRSSLIGSDFEPGRGLESAGIKEVGLAVTRLFDIGQKTREGIRLLQRRVSANAAPHGRGLPGPDR